MNLRPMGLLTITAMCLACYAHSAYAEPEERGVEEPQAATGYHAPNHRDDDGHHAEPRGGNGRGSHPAGGPASATTQAIVDYCSRIDAAHTKEYVQLGNLAQNGDTTTGDAAAAEKTYASVTASLQEIQPSVGKANCIKGIKG